MNIIGRCPAINGGLPTVLNAYISNVDNVKQYDDGTVEGYYDVTCNPGYTTTSGISGRITCLDSNTWSQPLPQCNCR